MCKSVAAELSVQSQKCGRFACGSMIGRMEKPKSIREFPRLHGSAHVVLVPAIMMAKTNHGIDVRRMVRSPLRRRIEKNRSEKAAVATSTHKSPAQKLVPDAADKSGR